MENASKALFIVVGVLIGLLLLSLMIYVFRQGARVNAAYDQKQITNQLELYNARFEAFDRDNNNIIDAISLANLAYDVNNSCNYDPTLAVQIEIEVGSEIFTMPNTKTVSGRNKILPETGSEMSIYDLTNAFISNNPTPGVKSLKVTGLSGVTSTDTLSTTRLENGKTIYKYLFRVENTNDFEYHEQSLKVSRVKLTAYVNSEWKTEWD